jgi:hypothetical protein
VAERHLNKWTILLALQRRLAAGRVGLYEALLGTHALRLLFPELRAGDTLAFPEPAMQWAFKVAQHLRCIVDGTEWTVEDDNESWLAIWMSQPTSRQLVSEQAVEALLDSAGGLQESEHGLHEIQAAGEAARHPGAVPPKADS